MKTFTHIVIPTDFSHNATEALRMAQEIARGTPCRLSLVHVIADAWRQAWGAEVGVDVVGLEQEWRQEAEQRLRALLDETGLDRRTATATVLVGPPAAAIAEYADAEGADLIVMGRHGHGRLHRVLLGSVAERVVRLAHCPVLTVPPVAAAVAAAEDVALTEEQSIALG